MWLRPFTTRTTVAAAGAAVAAALSGGLVAGDAHAAPTLRPGDMIRLAMIEFGCTVGITGHLPDGAPVAITAGHCAPTKTGAAYRGLSPRKVGTIAAVTDFDELDIAVVRVHGQVPDSPIAGPGNVGDIVCKLGRVSGRTCGPIVAITDDEIVARVAVMVGDSGGPLLNRAGEAIGMTSRLQSADEPTPWQAAQAWGKQLSGAGNVRFPRADRIIEKVGLR